MTIRNNKKSYGHQIAISLLIAEGRADRGTLSAAVRSPQTKKGGVPTQTQACNSSCWVFTWTLGW